MTSKYITRTYSHNSVDSIEKADQEHMRLINLGYKVTKTYDFLFSCQMNYELIEP